MIKATSIFEAADLGGLLDRIAVNLVPAVERSQERIVAGAAAVVPVRTGFLRSTIHAEPVEIVGNQVIGEVAADAPYADHVERGTVKQAAQPYLRPQLDSARGEILEEFQR